MRMILIGREKTVWLVALAIGLTPGSIRGVTIADSPRPGWSRALSGESAWIGRINRYARSVAGIPSEDGNVVVLSFAAWFPATEVEDGRGSGLGFSCRGNKWTWLAGWVTRENAGPCWAFDARGITGDASAVWCAPAGLGVNTTATLRVVADLANRRIWGTVDDGVSTKASPAYSYASTVVIGGFNLIEDRRDGRAGVDFDNIAVTSSDPVAVQGRVVLTGYAGDNATVAVRFEFRAVGGGGGFVQVVPLAADGTFRVYVVPGTYNIGVKAMNSLQKTLNNVTVAADPTVLAAPIILKMGDLNGDDAVSFEDFALLQNAYGQRGSAGADVPAAAAGACGLLGFVLLSGLGLGSRMLGVRDVAATNRERMSLCER